MRPQIARAIVETQNLKPVVHEREVDGTMKTFVSAPSIERLLNDLAVDFDNAWVALEEFASYD